MALFYRWFLRLSVSARWYLVLCLVVMLLSGKQMVRFGSRGRSDLSVFYRTSVLLKNGAGGEVYRGKDKTYGWLICIPPAGTVWYQPLAYLSPTGAALGWLAINLLLVAAGTWAIWQLMRALSAEGWPGQEILPWLVGHFFLFAAGSIQVGQYSVLFAAFWLLAIWSAVKRRYELSALLLAWPTAIKIYPVLMLGLPFTILRRAKPLARMSAAFVLGLVFFSSCLPLAFYGSRVADMNREFLRYAIFSSQGREAESQTLHQSSNHGLDSILLRFLTHSDKFHSAGFLPHLSLAPASVLKFADPLRLLILLVTIAALAAWRRSSHFRDSSAFVWTIAGAVWSATLFLVLPGAKTRYAVYVILAFVPLFLSLAGRVKRGEGGVAWGLAGIILLTLAVTSFLPEVGRYWGAGFWGTLVLWGFNVRYVLKLASGAIQPDIESARNAGGEFSPRPEAFA